MKKLLLTSAVVVILATCSAWLLGDVYVIDPNATSTYTIVLAPPTHNCPVHGDLGGSPDASYVYIADFLTVRETRFCAECVYDYLETHLKANLPKLTKIEEGMNDNQ